MPANAATVDKANASCSVAGIVVAIVCIPLVAATSMQRRRSAFMRVPPSLTPEHKQAVNWVPWEGQKIAGFWQGKNSQQISWKEQKGVHQQNHSGWLASLDARCNESNCLTSHQHFGQGRQRGKEGKKWQADRKQSMEEKITLVRSSLEGSNSWSQPLHCCSWLPG